MHDYIFRVVGGAHTASSRSYVCLRAAAGGTA